MDHDRIKFSICIPAYNRAAYLLPLLESIVQQRYGNLEILICEDKSPERIEIRSIVEGFTNDHPDIDISLHENVENLGYDANIRNLVQKAKGDFCFFMGNDDIMAEGALKHVEEIIQNFPNAGLVIKAYQWFVDSPDNPRDVVRYVTSLQKKACGIEALSFCFRRCGVISGFVISRLAVRDHLTDEFDGTLYYQMHLAGVALMSYDAVVTPQVLVHCRDEVPPDFGNSEIEQANFVPGQYLPTARVTMISGVIRIATSLQEKYGVRCLEPIRRDYANHFYPYIRDQLQLKFKDYLLLYTKFCQLGFWRYPLFHVYFTVCYVLGRTRFDKLVKMVRRRLGRTLVLG